MASRTTAQPKTKLLRVLKSTDADFESEWQSLREGRVTEVRAADRDVQKVIRKVRDGGDDELLALVRKDSGAKLQAIEVPRDEWDDGCEQMNAADRAALGKAAMRVREFHRRRIPSSWEMKEEGGAFLGHRVRPLDRVGLYASPDDVRTPSRIVMNTIPASVVEVPEIVLATPPAADGTVPPKILMAARVAGVHRVFKVGGAPAIAALAYGTETIPAVDKIIGHGDASVSAAKAAVYGTVDLDGLGGPGEMCVIADRSATPAWLAADLISQAEQERGSRVLLLTHVKPHVARIQEQLAKQLKDLPRSKQAKVALAAGAVVVTRNLEESITLANRYAPEHLVLAVDDPEGTAKLVMNAGLILLGHYTPLAAGDYLAGPNSVLPTGGTARFSSPLGVDDFLKRTSFVKFEPPKLRELGAEVTRLAELDGLAGHVSSVDLRLQKIRRVRREREAAREAEA
jgi:histidinol dehydrogenase